MQGTVSPADLLESLVSGDCHDPFSVLGMHLENGQLFVRALLPGAVSVWVVDALTGSLLVSMQHYADTAFFFAEIPARSEVFPYRLRIDWGTHQQELEDAYRFPCVLGEMDVWLLSEGTHLRPYEKLGAHPTVMDGVTGVSFAVWAPNARRVSVVGDFNGWNGRRHMMRYRHECGVWEMFVPHVMPGDFYKYEIKDVFGEIRLKADPYAFRAQLRPDTASIVHGLPPVIPSDKRRKAANAPDAPISIYEVHAGSWRVPDGGQRWLTYRGLAQQLIPYVRNLGFTHIELMPVNEYPFDDSWGYQSTGIYAPTARYGTPEDFRYLVEMAHENGIGVILDWVPAHFAADAHGLIRFDGTALYEHEDPREGIHQEWGSLIYNFGRNEVCNYLVGNGVYWLERYGVDGLRVDAVASMLYRDYSRVPGEWIPNKYGGRENLEAIAFLKKLNAIIGRVRPEAVTMAEESTSFPGVSHPVEEGGLGFDYKWNLGWMNDTLSYMRENPLFRKYHHDKIRFGMMYAYSENFVLPLSHDEVVHCKSSLIGKMPGDEWQRFANLRAYFGFMWGFPGKKLLFMGGELAQYREWDSNGSLDWQLLHYPLHAGVQRLIRDLNTVYRDFSPLYRLDYDPKGFEWVIHEDVESSVFCFIRRDEAKRSVIVLSNFTPVPRYGYRIGVEEPGWYRELINTDAWIYGGSGIHNHELLAQSIPSNGRPWSLVVTAPPLATCMLVKKDD